MTVRSVPEIAVMFVAEHEACVMRAYDDARPNTTLLPDSEVRGKLTAGYGHTGSDVQIGMLVDAVQAKAWLQDDLATAAIRMFRVVDDAIISELTEFQYSALLSFVFNVGADPKWTIWKRLNAGAFDQVPLELMKFVNATIGGETVKMQSLVNRRAAEVALWSTQEPGTSPAEPPSSVTRTVVTPPTPSDPTPASKSKSLIAGGVGAVAAAGPMIDQVTHAIEPYSKHSNAVSTVLGILATLAAACVAISLIYIWIQKKDARN